MLRPAALIHPFVHRSFDNLISSPRSLACRGGLRPPRLTSPRCDEWREVYLWLHGALFLLRRPPAHRRLITHLSTERTLEWSTAPLLGYANTHKHSPALKHACTSLPSTLPNDSVISVVLGAGSCLICKVEDTFIFSLCFPRRTSLNDRKELKCLKVRFTQITKTYKSKHHTCSFSFICPGFEMSVSDVSAITPILCNEISFVMLKSDIACAMFISNMFLCPQYSVFSTKHTVNSFHEDSFFQSKLFTAVSVVYTG